MDLTGKVALITGAASGQGRTAAIAFAKAGARVGLSDVDGDGLERTAQLVREAGGQAVTVVGSVAEAQMAQAMVARTVEAFGKLNVLYNNAGIYWPHRGDAPAAELAEEMWDTIIDVNLKGVYLCTKYAIPALIDAGGGAIINIASQAGTRGARHAHAYAASKGGVIAFTYSLAVTYGPYNIRANAIAPGAIDTPMTRPLWEGDASRFQAILNRTPLGRIGTPDDVVNLALFLASDAAAWLTGAVIPIDGGSSLL